MPKYGDNIFELGALVGKTLRRAGWSREDISRILARISSAPSYHAAVAICREYITIDDKDEDEENE